MPHTAREVKMHAPPKLRVRHFVVVLLVAGLVSSFSLSALAELEFITQNIGYPVVYFEPVDIEGDGIWELALQVGHNGDSVGVYSALSGEWIDGPHYLPIVRYNWGCGDFDRDGQIEYLYLSGTDVIKYDTMLAQDTTILSVNFSPKVLQVWGTADNGESIVHLSQFIHDLPFCDTLPMGTQLTGLMTSRWHRFSMSTGHELESIDGGSQKGIVGFVRAEKPVPFLAVSNSLYGYSWLCELIKLRTCNYSFSFLPQFSPAYQTFIPEAYGWMSGEDEPICWYGAFINSVCLGGICADGTPGVFWQVEGQSVPESRLCGRISTDSPIEWSIDVGYYPYVGIAYHDIGTDNTPELLLSLRFRPLWEIRDPQTGSLVDSLPGLPPVDIRTAPIMEPDKLDLYYFLDSTLYILNRPGMPTGILTEDNAPSVPETFTLHQNYPNPFNASTIIEFELAKPGPVKLEIYNILGKKVAVLLNEHRPAGIHRAEWNGTDQDGHTVVSGIYFYRLATDGADRTRKMVLLK